RETKCHLPLHSDAPTQRHAQHWRARVRHRARAQTRRARGWIRAARPWSSPSAPDYASDGAIAAVANPRHCDRGLLEIAWGCEMDEHGRSYGDTPAVLRR